MTYTTTTTTTPTMAKLAQQPAPVADEEQSFPRGGASTITPLKRRQIRAEAQADAERDFFAGASAGAPAGHKRRKKGSHDAGVHVSRIVLRCQLPASKACARLALKLKVSASLPEP